MTKSKNRPSRKLFNELVKGFEEIKEHRLNRRNLPCPTCGCENLLTPDESQRGYECDICVDQVERGGIPD